MTLRLSAVSASFVSKLPRIVARRTAATVPTTPSPVTNKKSDVINQRADMLEQIDIEDLPRAQKRFAKQFEQVNDERIKEIFAKNYKMINLIPVAGLDMTPTGIFWAVLAVNWGLFLIDYYLSYRQYRVHKTNEKRPDDLSEYISVEEYDTARKYKLDKHHYNFAHNLYSQLENTAILCFGVLPILWNYSGILVQSLFNTTAEIPQSLGFALLSGVMSLILETPWDMYDTFVIEEHHGFNKQTMGFFITDKIKKFAVSQLISAPILTALIWIVRNGGEYFFFYAWILVSIVIFLLMTIYPEFIAPLFDKYVPLPDGELKTKIEELAARLSFPLTKLYVVHGSKRSTHSNAYMYGFWKNKRIVIYDTLLSEEANEQLKDLWGTKEDEKKTEEKEGEEKKEKKRSIGMQNDEVVAVLGHELGHWDLSHTQFNLLMAEVNLLLLFAVFAYFYRQESLYHAFGFSTQPTLIGLMIVFQFVTAPYNQLMGFIMSVCSRRMEFSADAYAAKLGFTKQLSSGLIKIGKDNLSLPIDDPYFSAYNHSHPPIQERLAALKKFQ
uniref:Ste24 endopeptidase n=2 Tax=Steinernema glaseri TaxID=37863 RepID=A0A1I7Z4B2_9BILA